MCSERVMCRKASRIARGRGRLDRRMVDDGQLLGASFQLHRKFEALSVITTNHCCAEFRNKVFPRSACMVGTYREGVRDGAAEGAEAGVRRGRRAGRGGAAVAVHGGRRRAVGSRRSTAGALAAAAAALPPAA